MYTSHIRISCGTSVYMERDTRRKYDILLRAPVSSGEGMVADRVLGFITFAVEIRIRFAPPQYDDVLIIFFIRCYR